MDRQQADGVGALLLRNRLELLGTHRLLVAHEAEEALDVPAAQLLVRARQPRELAQVRVPAPAVPVCEHREVVVVLDEDLLAETLERQAGRGGREPVVSLLEGAQQPLVLGADLLGPGALEPREDGPAARGAPEQVERVVRDADERRGEHRDERLVVVPVLEQAQVRDEVDHLLLAEVAAAGRAVRRNPELAQLLLVPLCIRSCREEQDDLSCGRRTGLDQLPHSAGDVARLGSAPVDAGVGVRRLVGDQELDRVAEHGIGELTGRRQPLEALAEVAAEQEVDGLEDLGAGAVVLDERQAAAVLLAALAEDGDVGVAEPVDRLKLVADEEDVPFARAVGEQVDEIALEAVRVLELVDHDRLEAQRLPVAKLLVIPEEVAGHELEILEVEGRLTALGGRVRAGEAVEQLLEEIPVPHRELVERRLLRRDPGLLVARGPLAARAVRREVEEVVRPRLSCDGLEQRRGARALELGSRGVLGETASRVAQRFEPLPHRRALAELEHEIVAGRAERLVDAGDHPPQAARAVRRQQPRPLVVSGRNECVERLVEGLARENGRVGGVKLAEPRVEARLERICLQEAVAEAVDGGDPGAVEPPRKVGPAPAPELRPDPRPQLSRRALRVGDDEDRLDVEAAVADRFDEALDEHGRLPRPCSGRDEDPAFRFDGRPLLGVRLPGHARFTRHIGHTSHQVGHSPPFGSWITSPSRIRPANRRAVSRAPST